MLLSSLGRQFPEYGLFYVFWGLCPGVITVVLSWLGQKPLSDRKENHSFGIIRRVYGRRVGLAVTGVMLAVSIV